MARQFLRVLGTRYGLAGLLAIVVLAVVGVARLAGGTERPTATPPAAQPSATVPPASDADLGDDSVASSEGPAVASSIPGKPGPEAVALSFTEAWLHSRGVTSAQWVNGMKPHATPRLISQLDGADPASVPADALNGAPQVRVRDSELVEATIPVKPGLLRLRVVLVTDKWLVDSVDWERP